MKEYIERASVHSIIEQTITLTFTRGGMHEQIDSLPAADVVEVRHGRWNVVEALSDDIQTAGECNICGENISWFGKFPNYCPNCGARMDKEDDHEVS